ncbi:unnamed protein product [Ascophyllum nodosum]
MSVIGIDFGNDTCKIGIAARGGIDIILNESSNRKNPSLVSFQGKQRLMGEGAASIARSNFKNTVREVKRLIGRSWGDPDLEADLKRLPFKCIEHPETGGVGIQLEYDDAIKLFTPEQIMACMFTKLLSITKSANNGIDVADTVLGIPGWYTDPMRSAMMNACSVAGVNCLRLMHEHTATALAYGIYKSAKGEFHEKDPHVVLFVDLGHSTFSAAVVTFVQGSLTVKSAAFDSKLGGRDMDWAIAQYAADEFQAKTGNDPRTKPKALLKLLDSAERAKKQLSPVGVTDAPMNIECLWEDVDYTGRLSLKKLEELIEPLVKRMDGPVLKALKEAGVTKEQLGSIEIVGGATRVPLVKSHLADLLGRDKSALNFGLSCTMNADESIARGCALQCAMLSSRFKVKEFSIVEIVPYPIKVSWEGQAGTDGADTMPTGADEGDDDVSRAAAGNSLRIFSKGDETPKVRRMNFNMDKPFTLTATYDADAELPTGYTPKIGTFKVDVPEGSGVSKVRVNVKHDIHGVFSVQSAEMMKEVVKEALAATSKEAKTGDEASAAAAPMDVDGEEAGSGGGSAETPAPTANGGASKPPENGPKAAEAGAKGQEGDAEAAPKKKVYNKVPLKVEPKTSAWNKGQIDTAVLEEAQMANQDRVLRETADKRNELESYVYAMRDKLVGSLRGYVEGAEADNLSNSLTAAEDWLYSDEGFDSTKSVYSAKLKELTDLGQPVENRLYENNNRQDAASELQRVIDGYVKFANSSDDAYGHIESSEKAKVRECSKSAEKWLFQKLDQQANIPPSKNPIVTCEEIRKQALSVHATCRPIMNTPKPAPKPAEPANTPKEEGHSKNTPPPEGKGAETAEAEAEPRKGGADKMDAEAAPADAPTAAPMETDEVEQLE